MTRDVLVNAQPSIMLGAGYATTPLNVTAEPKKWSPCVCTSGPTAWDTWGSVFPCSVKETFSLLFLLLFHNLK